jgi:hypothetical protein
LRLSVVWSAVSQSVVVTWPIVVLPVLPQWNCETQYCDNGKTQILDSYFSRN